MEDGGNRMKEPTEANVKVSKQVREKQVHPFGFLGKVRPDSELRSLSSMPETIGSHEGCRAGEGLQGTLPLLAVKRTAC